MAWNPIAEVWKRGFNNVVQGTIPNQGVLALNLLWDNPGAMKKVRSGRSRRNTMQQHIG